MIEIKEIHENLKVILKKFHELCVEQGINYSLFGGSLIGAIREKGFIPWDDDADIMMERSEYNKLLKILPEDFKIINILWVPRLIYKDANDLEGGNYIDILVFDKAPNSKIKHNFKVFGLKFLQGTLKEKIIWSNYNLKGKLLTFITFIIGKLIPKRTKLLVYEYLAQSDNKKQTNYVCSYKDQYRYIHIRYNKELFSDYILIPFEDLTLMSMIGYHEYLSLAFGDYMKLPPVEERVPIHGHIKI